MEGACLLIITIQYLTALMYGLQSPQYSSSSKADPLTSKADHLTKPRSPSFRSIRSPSSRNQRIPSQEQYLCHSNQHLRSSKQDSPSKGSEEIKRRKSQLVEHQPLTSSKKKQKNPHTQNAQQIINSIQDLKEEYRTLKQAYKELIQEKVKHTEEMAITKHENNKLKNQIQEITRKQVNLSNQNTLLKHNLQAIQKQLQTVQKELQKQRHQAKKLQNDLYFFNERQKSKTDHLILHTNMNADIDSVFTNPKFTDTEHPLTEQRLTLQEISEQNTSNNESHLLSFSLTSLIDQSIRQEKFTRMRKEHVKVVSDLPQMSGRNQHFGHNQQFALHQQFGNIDLKPKRQSSNNFKKQKKDPAECKVLGSPLCQLLSLKSPLSSDKKNIKNICVSATTKRRKIEQKQNIQLPRNQKKRSKKLQIGSTNE